MGCDVKDFDNDGWTDIFYNNLKTEGCVAQITQGSMKAVGHANLACRTNGGGNDGPEMDDLCLGVQFGTVDNRALQADDDRRGESAMLGFVRQLFTAALVLGTILQFTQAETRTVRLNNLKLGIDERTGSLVRLSYPATGVILQAPAESVGLVDLAYPLDSFAALRLASRFSRARVMTEGKGIHITWDALGPSRTHVSLPDGKVSAQVSIRPAEDGRSIIMSCRIENHSQAAIRQVIVPDLWGLRPFDGVDRTQLRLARGLARPFAEPLQKPHTAPFYVRRGGWNEYRASGYYGENALRWLDYGSLGGGLSMVQKKWGSPDLPNVLTHRSETAPMALRLLWEHQAKIEPGGTWESGEFWFTPHGGGWAKGIEVYRYFVRQVYPPRDLPRHVRDGLGFQTIWMIQTVETDPNEAAFRYKDLPTVARDAIEHGIDEIVPWGWCTYSTMPIPVRDELGSRQEFLGAIETSRKLGVNIAPFISIQILRNRYADRYGVEPATSDWTYHYELIPNFRPYSTKYWDGARVASDNPIWQQDVKTALIEWLDGGLPSFSWDVFETGVERGQKAPLVDLIEEVRQYARRKDPKSTFSGESVTVESLEHDGRVLDYTWNWLDYTDAGPILNVLKAPRLNCNVEDSSLVVKKAFADGLYLNVMPRKPDRPNGTALISEITPLSRALKEVAPLRKQFLPFLVEGIFLGDSILREPSAAFVRSHQLSDRLLIVVLNDQSRTERVTVQANLDLWLPPAASYQVNYFDSSGQMIRQETAEGSLWVGVTPPLDYLGLGFFAIEAQ